MGTDSAILLLLADLRVRIAELEQEIAALREQAGPKARPAPMPTWDQDGPTGDTTR